MSSAVSNTLVFRSSLLRFEDPSSLKNSSVSPSFVSFSLARSSAYRLTQATADSFVIGRYVEEDRTPEEQIGRFEVQRVFPVRLSEQLRQKELEDLDEV